MSIGKRIRQVHLALASLFVLFLHLGSPSPSSGCLVTTSLTADQWRMISLACDTGTSNTVQDVFGDDLDPLDYGVRWVVFEHDSVAQLNHKVNLDEALTEGEGYWIKTLDSGQSVSVDGVANSPIAVPLVTDPAGRQNLVGHPFDFDVCWSLVEVIDGASTLSLDQADPLIGSVRACSMDPPDPSCVMSRIGNRWNGAAYQPFDGETPGMEGILEPLDGLWVKAFKSGIALRIPADSTPAPVADAGPDRFICLDESVVLGTPALADHTYSWSPGGETTAQIPVAPLVTTTYTVTATTACGSAQDSVTVWVDDGSLGIAEDFEGDVSDWTTSGSTGLWHLTDSSTCPSPEPGYSSPTHAFYYGQDAPTCNYDTGAQNAGDLTSPLFGPVTESSTLSFMYVRDAESGGGFDETLVEVVDEGGVPTTLLDLQANSAAWTESGPHSLAAFAGQNVQLRFSFDTVDDGFNDGLGWFVDDVTVACVPRLGPCDLGGDFEGDVSGWSASGLWNLADDSPCTAPELGYTSPTHAFHYGVEREFDCDYDTSPESNSGSLTSPLITGITSGSELSFMYQREAEIGFDVSLVEIVTQSGSTTVLDLSTVVTSGWTASGPISLAAFAGQDIQVRFTFDTVDEVNNLGFGWFIDDVVISDGTPCATSLSFAKVSAAAKAPDAAKPPAGRGPRDWYVRLSVASGDLSDDANVLGQLANAADGYDYHDLPELPPFGDRYLSIVFPHDDWGDFAGDYTTDFRAPHPPLKGEWRFDVIGAGFGGPVTLTWAEHGTPLRGWFLIDEETGERIRIVPGGSYSFSMPSGTRRSFRWVHGSGGNGNGGGKR